MDLLLEVATEYTKLFDKDYVYILQNDLEIQLFFAPRHFHHLLGFQKLKDIDILKKGPKNSADYIFKNILRGRIKLSDIEKSKYFNEIEHRFGHFRQIKRIIEFEKVIIKFDPSLITSKLDADYILFKRSNDNMYLNLFLKTDPSNSKFQIPNTFIPSMTDYYTYGQKVINIVSMTEIQRITKRTQK